MKNTLILIGILLGLQVGAQSVEALPISTFSKARTLLDQNHPFYNPEAGFLTCKKAAEEEHNPEAMNVLAILYNEGVGVKPNQKKALEWFETAAKNGYLKSWYNVGLMHQNGYGTNQDFKRAFEYYNKGAEIGSASSMYGKGYLYYKGLGCKQSYPEAIKLFKQSVKKGSLGSMYLLGLCYRNGYGIEKDQDSARYWLTRAANYGYELATNEMMEPEPEFIDYPATSKSSSKKETNENNLVKAQFEKVEHSVRTLNQIKGHYTGYIVTYDWSGKHMVSKNAIALEIMPSANKNTFTGTWKENNDNPVPIKGLFKDSKVVFNNTSYFKTDHYSSKTPIEFIFKDATFTTSVYEGSTFLAGNLQLWDVKRNEPEKPMYMSLVKQSEVSEPLNPQVATNDFMVVPNPFENSFSFNLSLDEPTTVNVNLYTMGGNVLYTETLKLEKGNHNHTININLPSGSYVLKVKYGSETKSTIIVKS